MTQISPDSITQWTTADLELFPQDGKRYEIIDGELFVTTAPHWYHQRTCGNIYQALNIWSQTTNLGQASLAAGIIFTDTDNVIPDVLWVSNERLTAILDDAGHLTAAPELAVEVLSPGTEQIRRDRELKLKLYSIKGVREYWIVDWRSQQVEIYQRDNAILVQTATLFATNTLTSPLLPNFNCPVSQFFG